MARTTRRPPYVKCNTDVVFDQQKKICAIAAIFRDHHGNIITGSSKILPVDSLLAAEALAMKEAHRIAANCGMEEVIFESECSDLVYACENNKSPL